MNMLRGSRCVILLALLAGLVVLGINSCSSPSTSPDDETPDGPTVIEKVSSEVTEAGATLALKNGMMLELPAGAVSDTIQVELSQLGGDKNFKLDFQTVLDINADGQFNGGYLRIPLPADQDTALLGAAFRSEDGEELTHLLFLVDASGDTMIVDLASVGTGKRTAGLGSVPNGQYIVEVGPSISVTTQKFTGQFCYYEQDYGTCWAAAWLMLLKTYANRFAMDEIYKLLAFTRIGPDDGLNWHRMDDLAAWTEMLIDKKGEYATFCTYSNFINQMLDKLSQGYPVLANMNTHQGLFVGYEITNPGPNQEITLTYHDPQMANTQLPYRVVTAAQLKQDFWDRWPVTIVNYFSTFCINEAPPAARSLQTIELMDTQLGAANTFVLEKGMVFAKGNAIVDRVVWDYTKAGGLSFQKTSGRPRDITGVHLRGVRVFNMHLADPAPVKVKTSLYRVVNGSYKIPALQVKEKDLTVSPGTGRLYVEDFLVDDYADNLRYGDTLFALQAELFSSSGQFLDDFDVVFSHYPLRIRSINPTQGEPGVEVEIRGIGFGRDRSQVTFSGVATGIVSWSDTLIIAEVPQVAGTSEVVVTVGGYSSNSKSFTAASLLDKVKRCRFEQFNAFGWFETVYTRMFGIFWPVLNNERNLQWNGHVATKDYTAPIDGEYTETYHIRIVFDPSGASIDSIVGYNRIDRVIDGKLTERSLTELGAVDVPLQMTYDNDGSFECYYWIEKDGIASRLTKLQWMRNSYNPDGSVYTADTLTSVDWFHSSHEGEIKLLMWENYP